MVERDRGIGAEEQISFRYCPKCQRYSSMVKLNNKWICQECGYQEEIKILKVNDESEN